MLCLKILVFYIIAQCYGHHISLQKGLKIHVDDGLQNVMAYIRGKWIPFGKIEAKGMIRKRESEIKDEILPLKVEVPPAPVIEKNEEKEDIEAASSLFGFQRPERILSRLPLTRSVAPRLNTNIQDIIQTENFNPPAIPSGLPARNVGEFYEGLPPRPVEPIPATGPTGPAEPFSATRQISVGEPISAAGPISAGGPISGPGSISATGPIPASVPIAENELVPILVPPPNNRIIAQENNQETPPSNLFDRFKVRRYAVYAGDVILKYLSQFFNRARITFNRFVTPSPPTPEFMN